MNERGSRWLDAIYRVSDSGRVAPETIAAAERSLGTTYPAGYAQLLTAFGCGIFSSTAHLLDPARAASTTRELREGRESARAMRASLGMTAPQQPAWLADALCIAHRGGRGPLWWSSSQRALYEEADDVFAAAGDDLLAVFARWLDEECAPPYVFEPFERRARFILAGESASARPFDDTFERFVDAFRAVRTPDLEAVDADRGNQNRHGALYFRAIGGVVDVFLGGAGVSVHVTHDAGCVDPLIDDIVAARAALGLARMAHPEG